MIITIVSVYQIYIYIALVRRLQSFIQGQWGGGGGGGEIWYKDSVLPV